MATRSVGRFAGALAVRQFAAAGFAGQSPEPKDASVVERASKYVAVYQQAFSAVGSEEHHILFLESRGLLFIMRYAAIADRPSGR